MIIHYYLTQSLQNKHIPKKRKFDKYIHLTRKLIMPTHQEIKKCLLHVSENVNALDVLLQFEDVLEKSGLYVYEHWELGEVVSGPKIEKHWIDVTLMYPNKKMPEPVGAMRLVKIGAKVKMGKETYEEPVRVYGPEDIRDPITKQAKMTKNDVWIVNIRMPRRIIDQEIEEYLELKDIGYNVDTSSIEDAYQHGIDGYSDAEELPGMGLGDTNDSEMP